MRSRIVSNSLTENLLNAYTLESTAMTKKNNSLGKRASEISMSHILSSIYIFASVMIG